VPTMHTFTEELRRRFTSARQQLHAADRPILD
jgi:hypothetical protein